MGAESLAAVIMVGATVGLFVVWSAMQRHSGRWRRVFRPSTWLRAMKWTLIWVAAAGFGSLIAGGRQVLALAVIVGSVLLAFEAAMWTHAKAFGERDDDA